MEWLLIPYLLFLYFPLSFCTRCNHYDQSSLLQFKNSFVVNTSLDLGWFCHRSTFHYKTESWKSGTDCCQWDGVTCDTTLGHVINLDLSCSQLEGQIHPNSTLFSLRHLQQLNLDSNNFSGSSIGSAIGDLVNLTRIKLSCSRMSGDFPSTISHLSKLVSLDLNSYDCKKYDPNDPRMRLDPYTWKKLIHNATSLGEIRLDGVDMSSIGVKSLSLLTNLSSSLVNLSLADTKLKGNLSSDILCLPNLQELHLSANENLRVELPKSNWSTPLRSLELYSTPISGDIPDSIGHLKFLRVLDISNCSFGGRLPSWLVNLTQLYFLDLSYNKLVGQIPTQINTLQTLFFVSLASNMLNGTIPNSICKLKNLTYLHLSSNKLSGLVKFHQFSKLKNLTALDLSYNSFLSINFESTVDYILPKLVWLDLSSCNVNSFPKFSTPNLETLILSHNKIRGTIPKWFHEKILHSWKNISYIDLSFNKLQGDLPSPPSGIKIFLVSNNELTGDIPSAMCNASSLTVLNLAHNNLTGLIPQCLGTFPSLSVLDLQMNNLYGNIPQQFSKKNEFKTIKLNGNHLKGPLPRALARCTSLEILDLGNNDIEDTFPYWLEALPTLQVLILRSNKFHGVITSFSTKKPFPKLRVFDLSNNNFTGPLPASYIKSFQGVMDVNVSRTGLKYMGSQNGLYNDSVMVVMKGVEMKLTRILTTFTTIDLSKNMFEGEIPKVIGELHFLIGLNLSHNEITGIIPLSLSNLTNLEWLDLSCNLLKGEIPMALTKLNFLAVLNLSHNQFEGTIPTGGQFNTFGNDSYGGNPMLCGLPLSKSCNGNEEWKPHSTLGHEESGFGWKAVTVGYACGTLFGILLGYNVFFKGKPQWLARYIGGMLHVRV